MCPHTSRLAVTVFLPLSQEGGPMTGGVPFTRDLALLGG